MVIEVANRIKAVEEYYFSKKLRAIRAMENDGGLPIINLGIGSPDLPPSPEVLEIMKNEVMNVSNHQYQPYIGIAPLREAISEWYKTKFDIAFDANTELLPLMGSKEGITHISMSFLNPGDEVLVPNPGYPSYTSATKMAEAIPVPYDLTEENGWLPDLKALEERDLSKVKIMWVNYPNMPTGTNATLELFKDLVAFGLRNNILICNDNPYSFILNTNPLSIFLVEGAKKCCLELNSLSKSHNMAGWRIGVIAGAADYISTILRFKSNMDSGMFKPTQMAAVKALQLGPEWYTNLNEEYASRRVLIRELLDKLNCTYDTNQVGMFLWAKAPDHVADVQAWLDEILHKYRIFITPGFIFGSNGERFVRLSLCTNIENLKEVLHRVSKVEVLPL